MLLIIGDFINICLLPDSRMSLLQLRGSAAGLHIRITRKALKTYQYTGPKQLNQGLWELGLGMGDSKSSLVKFQVQPGFDNHHPSQ